MEIDSLCRVLPREPACIREPPTWWDATAGLGRV